MKEVDINGIGMTSLRTRNRLVDRLREQGRFSARVMDAISQTPRHLFVEEALAHRAYEDTALPIGYGQTISQPYIVARMTDALLQSGKVDRVLEIGTGSGYQSAVLSRLVGRVFTVERIKALHTRSKMLLRQLSITNVQCRHFDGWDGWSAMKPFDGIIVTAASREVPGKLLVQLSRQGGRMVVPVGSGDSQQLLVITRNRDTYTTEALELVRFVPLLTGLLT